LIFPETILGSGHLGAELVATSHLLSKEPVFITFFGKHGVCPQEAPTVVPRGLIDSYFATRRNTFPTRRGVSGREGR
jgi:hypothetical protein